MKRVLLLIFLMGNECCFVPALYCASVPLHEIPKLALNEIPQLELDGEIVITSEDEEMLEFLAQDLDEPSILWTLFCSLSSTALARLIRAKRYVDRMLSRMKTWIQSRINR